MKTILTSFIVCVFLQVVWVSVSTGQTDPCSAFQNQTACCKSDGCGFFICTDKTAANTSVCVNATSDKVCPKPDDTQSADQCSASPTPTPVTDPCNAFQNQTACCKSDGCGFFICTDKTAANTSVCVNATSDKVCPKPDDTQSADQCSASPTPTPTPTPATDPCSAFQNQTACCKSDGCGFFICTDKTAANTSVCVNATSDKVCPNEGDTQSADQCSASPTPTPTPTPATDTCEAHSDNKIQCCNLASTLMCAFYNCTSNVKNTTVCTNKTAGDICPNQGDQAIVVSCTVVPVTTSTASSTTSTSTKAPSSGGSGQHFDGASFIGGIVLCAGIVAIAYFGLKFYRSRQERNYHTL